jgi:F-type H+-transporting ATPase subunit b
MHIDWVTVLAQIVNFLLLVFLLKRFLYGPILAAMDERERKIAAQYEEASAKAEQAERERAAFQAQTGEMARMREQLVLEARGQAESVRQELVDRARAEIEERRAGWLGATDREREMFVRSLSERVARAACSMARRAVGELSGSALELSIVERFAEQLEKLDEGDRRAFVEAAQTAGQPIVVQSAFDASAELRHELTTMLRRQLAPQAELRFETSPELICGIRLSAGGRSLAWSLGDAITELEEGLAGCLDAPDAHG